MRQFVSLTEFGQELASAEGASDVLFPVLFWRLDVSYVLFSLSSRPSAVGTYESVGGDGLVSPSNAVNLILRTHRLWVASVS